MRLNLDTDTDYFTINNKFFEIGDINQDDIKKLREKEKPENIRPIIKEILKRYNSDSKVEILDKKEINRIGVLISKIIIWEKK